MQELNWGVFKAKFDGKEHASFQRLCYHLFLAEFNRPLGLVAYKNQTGIETEPLEQDGNLVGFQAKFFEARLSEKKSELIDAIKKAKRENPELDRLLFYLNQEFTESSSPGTKDPKYKSEIEKAASDKGIDIEWRVPSHLDAQLALKQNMHLAEHFFSNEKGVLGLISELQQHAEGILASIRTSIPFNDHSIKIDRSDQLRQLQNALSETPILLIAGTAGVGKTAVVRDFYDALDPSTPKYVFKATEFNLTHINRLLGSYGDFTLSSFVDAHKGVTPKYVVIDSAEKLSDIQDKSAFQEFIVTLVKNQWSVLLTARYGYLSDLRFQFIEAYDVQFESLIIDELNYEQLNNLSRRYDFSLPSNHRLYKLLRNPFYLAEYLRYYTAFDSTVNYSDFRDLLWSSQITKDSYRKDNVHVKREELFLKMAQARAIQGNMFISPEGHDREIIALLESDEVIKYDASASGYFITHDIYEEWALEIVIDRAFQKTDSYIAFFEQIGTSLAMRRAFRLWVSEQLSSNSAEIKSLLSATLSDQAIEQFWRDEACVAALLSDYAETFIQNNETKLLENDQQLLVRLIFLLRLACKDVDEEFLHLLGIRPVSHLALQFLFTKPFGKGWNALIAFVNKHKSKLGLKHIHIVLPMLLDWTTKSRAGDTTRQASQTALFYYDQMHVQNAVGYSRRDEITDQTVKVILYGACEVTTELETIFEQVLKLQHLNHRDPYYALLQTMLTSITECVEVAKCLPQKVLDLAKKSWKAIPKQDDWYGGHSIGVEQYFGIADEYHQDYFPASALQTPIFALLQHAPDQTIAFIVEFVNDAAEQYRTSQIGNEVEEILLHIDGQPVIKQYISNRLWNAYRGTQVSTCLLESVHMALERWLLHLAKTATAEELQEWCIKLLKNSMSASITGVVTSIVLAFPYKLFSVAAILFRTKEIFKYDASRLLLDQQQKGSLLALKQQFPTRAENQMHETDRINACDDPHRKECLEHLALRYQIIQANGESNDEVSQRQGIIWSIWDEHYSGLPDKSQETDADKTWRLFMARMDSRKMTPKVEELDGKTAISFNPEIDSDLKKFSESSLEETADKMKYVSLKVWSEKRFSNTGQTNDTPSKYDGCPDQVLSETKEILDGLRNNPDETYVLFNGSIPAYTCSVLLRDYSEQLTKSDRVLCKEVILYYASIPISTDDYSYQVGDGVDPAISSLPLLLKHFPKDQGLIAKSLVLILLNPWNEIAGRAAWAIFHQLWDIDHSTAEAILITYLLLEPKYRDSRSELRKADMESGVYQHSEKRVIEHFLGKHESLLEEVLSDCSKFEELGDLSTYNLDALTTAFELVQLNPAGSFSKRFINNLFPIVAPKLFAQDQYTDDERQSPYVLNRLRHKLAFYVLSSPVDEIPDLISPLVENFQISDGAAEFFSEFVSTENRLGSYEAFWVVWHAFYSPIVVYCNLQMSSHYVSGILHNYLLAWPYWKPEAKEWRSLKDREKDFFEKIAAELGNHPAVLDSLAKLLNEIGSTFLREGITWISNMICNNPDLSSAKLETNTLYYLENLVRRFALLNHKLIRSSTVVRNQLLVILDFLVERGSITGYLVREDIL